MYRTKSKSVQAILVSAGEFGHALRNNRSQPTICLQSLYTKHYKSKDGDTAEPSRGHDRASHNNTAKLRRYQQLLNLEYEGLKYGKYFWDSSLKRTCCIVAIEHLITGDGPGKSEYCMMAFFCLLLFRLREYGLSESVTVGLSGYVVHSANGCQMGRCQSTNYIPMALHPNNHGMSSRVLAMCHIAYS